MKTKDRPEVFFFTRHVKKKKKRKKKPFKSKKAMVHTVLLYIPLMRKSELLLSSHSD